MAAREQRTPLEVIESKSAVGTRLIVTRPVPQGSPSFWISQALIRGMLQGEAIAVRVTSAAERSAR